MKTNNYVVKTMMAIAIMFACSGSANAQLGNLMNKAKKTITRTAEQAVDKAAEKAKEKARKKMLRSLCYSC